ncbi:hypothetical protein B0H63DRAFT_507298 [Podospora didyma]|uniref:UBA domain-containing protein n=1 Tax=Podospora didyma TaxID=330526 RepID=A0AAE0NY20_9PEZI|nr:hypothetical protein B0H63DRAFT_507298 [Podospora didyma]
MPGRGLTMSALASRDKKTKRYSHGMSPALIPSGTPPSNFYSDNSFGTAPTIPQPYLGPPTTDRNDKTFVISYQRVITRPVPCYMLPAAPDRERRFEPEAQIKDYFLRLMKDVIIALTHTSIGRLYKLMQPPAFWDTFRPHYLLAESFQAHHPILGDLFEAQCADVSPHGSGWRVQIVMNMPPSHQKSKTINDKRGIHVWQMHLGPPEECTARPNSRAVYLVHETWLYRKANERPTSLESKAGRRIDYVAHTWALSEARNNICRRYQWRRDLSKRVKWHMETKKEPAKKEHKLPPVTPMERSKSHPSLSKGWSLNNWYGTPHMLKPQTLEQVLAATAPKRTSSHADLTPLLPPPNIKRRTRACSFSEVKKPNAGMLAGAWWKDEGAARFSAKTSSTSSGNEAAESGQDDGQSTGDEGSGQDERDDKGTDSGQDDGDDKDADKRKDDTEDKEAGSGQDEEDNKSADSGQEESQSTGNKETEEGQSTDDKAAGFKQDRDEGRTTKDKDSGVIISQSSSLKAVETNDQAPKFNLDQELVQTLLGMGFSSSEVNMALEVVVNDLDAALNWIACYQRDKNTTGHPSSTWEQRVDRIMQLLPNCAEYAVWRAVHKYNGEVDATLKSLMKGDKYDTDPLSLAEDAKITLAGMPYASFGEKVKAIAKLGLTNDLARGLALYDGDMDMARHWMYSKSEEINDDVVTSPILEMSLLDVLEASKKVRNNQEQSLSSDNIVEGLRQFHFETRDIYALLENRGNLEVLRKCLLKFDTAEEELLSILRTRHEDGFQFQTDMEGQSIALKFRFGKMMFEEAPSFREILTRLHLDRLSARISGIQQLEAQDQVEETLKLLEFGEGIELTLRARVVKALALHKGNVHDAVLWMMQNPQDDRIVPVTRRRIRFGSENSGEKTDSDDESKLDNETDSDDESNSDETKSDGEEKSGNETEFSYLHAVKLAKKGYFNNDLAKALSKFGGVFSLAAEWLLSRTPYCRSMDVKQMAAMAVNKYISLETLDKMLLNGGNFWLAVDSLVKEKGPGVIGDGRHGAMKGSEVEGLEEKTSEVVADPVLAQELMDSLHLDRATATEGLKRYNNKKDKAADWAFEYRGTSSHHEHADERGESSQQKDKERRRSSGSGSKESTPTVTFKYDSDSEASSDSEEDDGSSSQKKEIQEGSEEGEEFPSRWQGNFALEVREESSKVQEESPKEETSKDSKGEESKPDNKFNNKPEDSKSDSKLDDKDKHEYIKFDKEKSDGKSKSENKGTDDKPENKKPDSKADDSKPDDKDKPEDNKSEDKADGQRHHEENSAEAIEGKPVDETPLNQKSVDEKAVDKTADENSVDEKPVDEKTMDEKTADVKTLEEKPADKKPADKKPVDKKALDEMPADKKSVNKKPVDEEPADANSLEEESFEAKSEEGKLNKPKEEKLDNLTGEKLNKPRLKKRSPS